MSYNADDYNGECDDGLLCDRCGEFISGDEYDPNGQIIADGTFCCDACLTAGDLLCPLKCPDDLFKAQDMSMIADFSGYTVVDELFCDASGFGSPYEPALTKEQATARADQILQENKHLDLWVGITRRGQFQVYVTVFKK